MRSDGDLVTIERSLGLKSERGISRQGNKDNPLIQDLLADIKTIALRYTDKPNTEIRASSVLEQESLELFGKYAALIWPSANQERPNWLAEPSSERYDGKYPRALHHDVPEERQILSELFHALVVEKCVKYHDNQLQKARRLNRKSEAADYEVGDVESNGNHAASAYLANSMDIRGGQVSSPASIPHGLPYSDDPDDELDSQDEDAFSDGSGSRTKSQRLQDYRDEIARASESYLHAADGNLDSGRKRRRKHEQDVSSKRMREISDGDAPQKESLIVQLQVNREALSRLVASKSEQRPDMSHRESAPRDEIRDASGNAVKREHSDTHTPPASSLSQQNEPTQRRASGFQAINASHDGAPATVEPASEPVPATASSNPVPAMATIQPLSTPVQQVAIPRRPSAVNSVPLRIIPLDVAAAEATRSNAPREPQMSSEMSGPPHTSAEYHLSGRSSNQSGSSRNEDPHLQAPQTAAPRPTVQSLTSQPSGPFRDHGHAHHAFRVNRPFVPQQQHSQHPQNHQHHHPPQTQHQPQPQPQSQQHQPPQHQHSQYQLQHQFVARPPQGPGLQQHGPQRPVAPQPQPSQTHQHHSLSPRQILPASNLPANTQGPPVRRHSPHPIAPSNVRRNAFVEEILGDLIRCPVVAHILAADSNLDQQQLNNLKTILTNHPETRDDMEVLLKRMTSLMDPTPPRQRQQPQPQHSPNVNPAANLRAGIDIGQTLGNPGHLQRTPMPTHTPPMSNVYPGPQGPSAGYEQSPRLKSEPMEDDKLMSASPHTGSFENVSIEINWGRQLEFSDYMEMQHCSTTKDFFGLVEAHIPDEIAAEGHTIKEIRVKALKDLKGGNLLPRIVRDEGRGRAAIRHLIKKLRAQSPDSEPELMFVVVWNDKQST